MSALVELATILVRHLGEDARGMGLRAGILQAAQERIGGRTFYVAKLKPCKQLEELRGIIITRLRFVGQDIDGARGTAEAILVDLRSAWKVDPVYLPSGRQAKAARRAATIRAEAEATGATAELLAERHGLTVRHVQNILRKVGK